MPFPDAPTAAESFEDTWEFEAGDDVPGWLAHAEGLRALVFNERTTVFADLAGRFWVMPHRATQHPLHCVGYRPDVKARVRFQGQGILMLMNEPIVPAWLAAS